MQTLILVTFVALLSIGGAAQALAHGGAPHPKCKPGYALDAEHKCVKVPKR
jgi:hypothetical protein